MEKIFDYLFLLLKDTIAKRNDYLSIIIISILFLLVIILYYIKYQNEFSRVFSFFLFRKNRTKEKIELTDSKTDKVIKDILESAKFKKYTGINVEKARRKLLIDFHEKNSLDITWNELSAAISFINYTNNKINIQFNRFSKVLLPIAIVSMILVFLFGLFLLFFILNYLNQISLKEIIALSTFVVYFWTMAIILFNNFYNLSCAKKISTIINKR